MLLTYRKLQDLRFLKTQLFDRVIARCILEKIIDLHENWSQQPYIGARNYKVCIFKDVAVR